jgi:hypothetical protein
VTEAMLHNRLQENAGKGRFEKKPKQKSLFKAAMALRRYPMKVDLSNLRDFVEECGIETGEVNDIRELL